MTDKETLIAMLTRARIRFKQTATLNPGNTITLGNGVELTFTATDELEEVWVSRGDDDF